MSICLCYKSAAAAACVHWQGPDRMPLSELHEAAPGKTLSASTERLPTVRPSLLHEGRRKRAIPTQAEPPTLGSALDRHWRLSAVQKRRNYHKYAFFEINISQSHHQERGHTMCVYASSYSTSLHWGWGLLLITSGVNWALILSLFWKWGILSESVKRHYILRRWAPDGRKEPRIGKWQRTRYGASSVRFTFLFIFSLKLV